MFIFVDNVIPEGNSLPEEPSVPELSPVFSSKSIGYEEETVSFSYNQLPTQILDDIFPISLNIFSHQESELEKVLLLKEYIKEDIDSRIGSEADIEFTILNSSNEWIQYTEEANKIKINNEDCIEDYLRRIVLRESAYDIGKTRDLCLIIATDYYDLGKAYAKQNDKEVAMDNYIKAIKYYKDSFNMKTEKGQYKYDSREIFYILGEIYHSIGNLCDDSNCQYGYYMSLAYYQLSFGKETNKINPYIYSGMVDLKTARLMDNKSSYYFLLDAENSFLIALYCSPKAITRRNINKHLAEVYQRLITYINNYGQPNGMQNVSDYKSKRELVINELESEELSKMLPSNN
jgi:tetratricopeptide (TPR) repeat protein